MYQNVSRDMLQLCKPNLQVVNFHFEFPNFSDHNLDLAGIDEFKSLSTVY